LVIKMTAFEFGERNVLVTTSSLVEGMNVVEYKGIVIADVTPGRHLGKDFMAGIRDLFGGRSRSWEKTLNENQQQALKELVTKAEEKGANAILNLRLEDEALGQGGMMNIKAYGTAVVVERSKGRNDYGR